VTLPSPGAGEAAPSPRTGWAVRAAIVFLALAVAGVLVRIFRDMLSPLIVATLLLLLIDGFARDLAARFPRAPRAARALIAGGLTILGFAAVILLLIFRAPPFAFELAAIEPRVNALLAQASALAGQQPITTRELFHGDDPSLVLGRAFRAARSAATYAGLTMLYLGFLLASRATFSRKLLRLFPSEGPRGRAERVLSAVRFAVERYVRLVTIKALAVGVVAFAVMLAFGVRSALFISFVVFLAAFVPIVGAFAGAAFPAVIAYAQLGDLGRALAILAILAVAIGGMDNLVMPKLQGDALNIDPLLVLISISFWGLLLGPTGVLLSTPLTVTIMAIAAEFDGGRWLAILISRDGEPLNEAR